MKKIIIASIVGAIIIFLWQFLSYAAMNLHKDAQGYTDKEQAILSFFESQGLEEGGYIIPNVPPGAPDSEREAYMQKMEGKPWASIQYHKAMDTGMVMNMIRGFVSNFVMVFLFCWILMKIPTLNFSTTLIASLGLGMIVFLNGYYINYIWYQNFDINASLLDCMLSWGIVGVWLGFFLNRRKRIPVEERKDVKSYEMAS